MSITSAKSGATGISLALDNNYMEPIATTLVGTNAPTVIEFLDIPQTYKHLQLRGIFKQTTAASFSNININLNADISTNYARHDMYGAGSGIGNSAVANSNSVIVYAGSGSAFGPTVTDILDYSNTNKFKTIRGIGGVDDNSSGLMTVSSGVWMNTNAITSIRLTFSNAAAAQYTRFSLYGIKG